MSRYVTDTHALVWHLHSSKRLSARVRAIFKDVDAGHAEMVVPTIVLVELVYLGEKARIDRMAVRQVFRLLTSGVDNYFTAPLDVDTVLKLTEIDRATVPEMPDRIIAATAKQLNLPLITRDPSIQSVDGLTVIW
jgi:predicted nucleic acid-binding protein